ncbi:extra-large guanine nucleotide-binding protein 1-like isoform X2 [Punica granatum]|uniref:Extra-large guanine nucleotide-binding protein 1-like isoform X2 n=1 Tax=Punica granatum TaxID=22663 RepID=A0A6P8CAL8_PUNGR|nr:extra-large guanine nucleotide-binding protein 1-like isoform X2 [Punica granatum]
MAAVLRRFVSLPPSAPEEDDDHSVEYSIALEYKGPLLFSDIPRAVPLNIDQIPTASVVPSNSWFLNLALPVISPVGRKGSGCKKTEDVSNTSLTVCSVEADGASSSTSSSRDENATVQDLDPPESPEVSQEGVRFEDHMRSEIVELESALRSSSSSCYSRKEEGSDYGSPHHIRKSSTVTFRDPDSGDVISDEESVVSEPDCIPVKQKAEKNEKKGACYRCLRGNRFTEKEVCIVCDAKYCRSCVLRAMGSMPEGRKCISCIGFRIDDSKRDSLGRCSRMLKRLLTDMEVKRVMGSEISCPSNQLPPNLVYVNDEPLNQVALALLQSCPNPPKKLRPGRYWYDKASGYWGKEGQKPCDIITAQLNSIGGQLQRNASNGNTNILINRREITREEVWMLKVAGIPCEGKTHYWVDKDGSYQEEGQKNVIGRLWEKRKTKLVCAMLSLPIPPSTTISGGEEGAQNKLEQNALRKLLLVGPDKSGTSTIFKQTKLVYGVPFTEDERQNIKLMIQSNLYRYLGVLLEGREQFAEESSRDESSRAKGKVLSVEQSSSSGKSNQKEDSLMTYSLGRKLKAFSDWLLKVIESGNLEAIVLSASREYAPLVEELWMDGAIQATYNRRSELGMLPRVATYFLERAIEISKEGYEPSDMDILYSEGITSSNSLASTDFSFPKSAQSDESMNHSDQHNSFPRLHEVARNRVRDGSSLGPFLNHLAEPIYSNSTSKFG